jgi:site-specific DNA recombinase
VLLEEFSQIWEALFPAEQTRMLKLLIDKVVVQDEWLDIRVLPNDLSRFVHDIQPKAKAS